MNFAEQDTHLFGRSDTVYYQYLLEYSANAKNWKPIANKTQNKTDVPHAYIQLAVPLSVRFIRLTNYHVPGGKFAVSGLRFFGKGPGKIPMPVLSLAANRDTTDARNVKLTWKKSPKAMGYNIRFGTQPGKLYENYQVFDTDTLVFTA